MKRETKIYDRENQGKSEGSFWELCLFAVVFVVIFTALARTAHATTLSASNRAQLVAMTDPNLIASSRSDGEPSEDMTITPIHMQTIPSSIPSTALPESNMAAGLPEPDSNKRFAWTSKLILDTSASLNTQEAKSYSGEYVFATGFKDQKSDIAALVRLGYSREYSFELADGTDGDYVDPAVILTKTWTEGKDFRSPVFDSIVLGLSTVGGASHEAARDTFVASTGPAIGVTKTIHKLHLGQKFGYRRRFYNYDIRDDGTVNAPDSFSSTTDVSYEIAKALAISAETSLFYDINYQGTGQTTEWSFLSLDYTVSKLIATSIGVATKRGTISDDGTYNEVKFVDGTVAQGFLDLILSF